MIGTACVAAPSERLRIPKTADQGPPERPFVNLRTQLVKNVLSNWAFLFLNFVIFFFLTPYIIDVLGTERSGIWFLLGSVSGYFGIAAFGIPGATEKYVAEYVATGNREQVSRIVSTSLFLSLWTAVIAAAGATVLCVFVDKVFRVGAAHASEARWVMAVVGVDVALSYPCALMFNVLKGFNRHDVRNAILIPTLLVKTAGFYVVLAHGGGVVALVLVQFAMNLAGYAAATAWVLSSTPWMHVGLRNRDRRACRLLLAYGALQFVAMAADRITMYTDRWIIAGALSLGGVTVYNVAAKMREHGRQISSGLDMAMRPAASHLQGLNDYAGLQKLLVTGGRVMVILLGALYILYATWGDRFIRIWLHGLSVDEATAAYICLLILIVPTLLTAPLGPGISVMFGIARHRPFAMLGIVVAVVSVALSLVLAHLLGIYGVAIGTIAPPFLIRGLYMYYYLPHITGMRPSRFIVGAWGRPLLALVPLAAILTGLRFVLEFDRLLWLMVFFLATGGVYALWVYLVVLHDDDKQLVRDAWNLIPRPSGNGEAGS